MPIYPDRTTVDRRECHMAQARLKTIINTRQLNECQHMYVSVTVCFFIYVCVSVCVPVLVCECRP